jgi:uncharacterized MnhB-related membrane protein
MFSDANLMGFMQVAILLFVGISGTFVVLTRKPVKQAIGVSLYGLLLAVMFLLFQAPDVALSQITVGAVALPLMILLALARVRNNMQERREEDEKKEKAA